MEPFRYLRAGDASSAVALATEHRADDAQYLAGGTTLVDLAKLCVVRPRAIVDIGPLSAQLADIRSDERGLYLGALVTMAAAAHHESVVRTYPAIAQSLALAASPQLRNMASLAGNVLQRTRCPYYRDVTWHACNKRTPGSGCAAREGITRGHAILGVSEHCIAAYPGDFAQALVALDAQVDVRSVSGTRRFAVEALHREPGERADLETILEPGDLITGFFIPAAPFTKRSIFVKVRDRESYDFALASAAVALDLRDGAVADVRIALGGLSSKPWRAREAEDFLRGTRLDKETAKAAADAAFAGAKTRPDNAFKVRLGKETLMRALFEAAR